MSFFFPSDWPDQTFYPLSSPHHEKKKKSVAHDFFSICCSPQLFPCLSDFHCSLDLEGE